MQHPLSSLSAAGPRTASDADTNLLIGLLLVILSAGAARLFGLDHLLVWHDEVFTLLRVFGYRHDEVQAAVFSGQLLTPDDLLRFQRPDPAHTWADAFRAFAGHPEHAPLYYALARLASALPLDPVSAARGVSAVFGVLLIPTVYWLTRELFGRGLVPWIAAALVACSPLQFLYAQEARQYALWLLLTASSSAALARAMRRDRRADWWLYGLFMTLGVYAHLLFVLIVPAHALYGLLASRASGAQAGRLGRLGRRWGSAVGVSLILFTPWLWVIATQPGRVDHFTHWMQRPAGLDDLLAAWALHPTRTFVDLTSSPVLWWSLLTVPLVWALARFVRRAPRPAVWLLVAMALAYIGVMLGPDLLLGGSRSLHARYALPALLAIQIMVAWVIGTAIAAPPGAWSRRSGLMTLALLIALGGWSLFAIQRAETWSTKNFSAQNADIARIANASTATLIVASESGVGLGELISLAYHLAPEARLWGQPWDQRITPPAGFETLIVLTPSNQLRDAIGPERPLTPLAGTWQWFAVTPRRASSDTPTAPPHANEGTVY
ncbi:glycosyltransferase family 39 protein [Thiocystis violascens]|uniref:Dolichyl-phosphate-mannose-protein mannosyltransferase n=1 Tax=Thiocystis violascens (strain ATCC 17096 / DSM 198 / 6111) TaxID=765911 RepID=I3YBZ3_THIV6|nr:glycosyltransferase family 39 protein [Thiocystis violascens]AFL74511.1 Dolichyl-phosphate-mannose-protein mannosyltransferase [Thiocystis violascens DSM 198]